MIFVVGIMITVPSVHAAEISLIQGLSPGCTGSGDCTICDFLQVFHNLARFVFVSAAGVALLMFLWGASCLIFNWGTMEQVAAGKKTILHTLVAVVIILAAWSLVNVLIYFMAVNNPTNFKAKILTSDAKGNKFFNEGFWWKGPQCQ